MNNQIDAATLSDMHTAVDRGDLDLLSQEIANRPTLNDSNLAVLPRLLRANRHPAALTVTNARRLASRPHPS